MPAAPLHPNEEERLQTLRRYEILDTFAEQEFDDIAHLTAAVCDAPVSLVTLVARHRQWFKARVGFDPQETERDCSFCAHAVQRDEFLLVPDTTQDACFVDNRLVVSGPKIRFYAGEPIHAYNGLPLGTLCVIDYLPRTLEPHQREALRTLARQVEAQLEVRRMQIEKERIGRFVVHDLKNPLASMILNADHAMEELERGESPVPQVRELGQATRLLHRMVLDLQDIFARDGGALTPRYQHVDLAALVETFDSQARFRFEEQAVTFETRIDPDARELVSDVELLRRILENLLYNSLEVAPAGSTITIAASRDGDCIHLRVLDEGRGVREEERERIFELDYQGQQRSSRGSRGIGLAFCRVAAEALGGSIVCEPVADVGASFRVTLPAHR